MPGCCRDKKCNEENCMKLPASKKCRDCVHITRCLALGYTVQESCECDFFPRRFVLRPVESR